MNIETAKRLYEYRKANGYSQEELAEKIGVSRQAISKWERSESSPDTDNLIALAKLYGVSVDTLLTGESKPEKAQAEENGSKAGNDYEKPTAQNYEAPKHQGSYSPIYSEDMRNYSKKYNALDTNRKKKRTRIIAAVACVLVVLIGISIVSIAEEVLEEKDYRVEYDDPSSYTAGGSNMVAQNINEISVEWINGNVNVAYYDGDTISFSENKTADDEYAMRYRIEGTELKIEFCDSGKIIGTKSKDLTINVPRDFTLAELDISSTNANVTINEVSANQLDVSTVSGIINASGKYNSVDAESTKGSININCTDAPSKIDANSVGGKITFTLPQDIGGFAVNYETVSGDIISDFDMNRSGGASRGVYTYGNSACPIEFESVGGDLVLKSGETVPETTQASQSNQSTQAKNTIQAVTQ